MKILLPITAKEFNLLYDDKHIILNQQYIPKEMKKENIIYFYNSESTVNYIMGYGIFEQAEISSGPQDFEIIQKEKYKKHIQPTWSYFRITFSKIEKWSESKQIKIPYITDLKAILENLKYQNKRIENIQHYIILEK